MSKKTALIWFTTDLRLRDNELLHAALQRNDEIIPVYCLDWAEIQQEQFGFKRMGARRLQFLLESVEDLQQSLLKFNAHLQVVQGMPEVVIPALAREYGATEVFAKKEVGSYELITQRLVAEELNKYAIDWSVTSTSTLFHPDDLPFSVRDIPEIFTDFRKRAERDANVRKEFPIPTHIPTPALQPSAIPSMDSLGVDVLPADGRAVLVFRGGEDEPTRRAQHYVADSGCLSTYKETRNGLVGADYSSKLSPWLAHGCISTRTIYWMVKDYERQHGANDSTYWLIFELIWRDYFRFAMKKHKSAYFRKGGIQGIAPKTRDDAQSLARWIQGKTGVDFVDANMNELRLTGFMSNRGRQNVASYLCNDLKLDWRLGAAYFEQELIDYDVASNWGNWAYLAGVGNDP
ncbi:MAG: DASH family cryptochrome, partial [Flavobacteriales bacterium]